MAAVFYKILFTVELQHESAPGTPCTSFGLEPTYMCRKVLRNHRMEYRSEPGKLTVYYSGDIVIENEDPLETKLVPNVELPDDTEFVFIVTLLERDIINKTVIPDEFDIAVTDTEIAIPQKFIVNSIPALKFDGTADTSPIETFNVFNSNDQLILNSTVPIDDDGVYNCTADLRTRGPGIYFFGLEGDDSLTRAYYVDTLAETNGHYGILRLVKGNTWVLPDELQPVPDMPDYNVFTYTFIKTP
ncbi:hypothetical protein [Polluticoccus soli]|uniref:hypothetical protein n=1 Tax=Polluticoccus soli TaxID=3034150 RepID=UPI0023E234C0|nr:hypothetical protein [Flavipsychrobacter sp. JY13-12]